jgi:hypothetical protein
MNVAARSAAMHGALRSIDRSYRLDPTNDLAMIARSRLLFDTDSRRALSSADAGQPADQEFCIALRGAARRIMEPRSGVPVVVVRLARIDCIADLRLDLCREAGEHDPIIGPARGDCVFRVCSHREWFICRGQAA